MVSKSPTKITNNQQQFKTLIVNCQEGQTPLYGTEIVQTEDSITNSLIISTLKDELSILGCWRDIEDGSCIIRNGLGLPLSRTLSEDTRHVIDTESEQLFILEPCQSNESDNSPNYMTIRVIGCSWKNDFDEDVHKSLRTPFEESSDERFSRTTISSWIAQKKEKYNLVVVYKAFHPSGEVKNYIVASNQQQTRINIESVGRSLIFTYDQFTGDVLFSHECFKSKGLNFVLSKLILDEKQDVIYKDTVYFLRGNDRKSFIAKILFRLPPLERGATPSTGTRTNSNSTKDERGSDNYEGFSYDRNSNDSYSTNKAIPNRIHIILLTGNIGAGKTSVLHRIQQNEKVLSEAIGSKKFRYHYFTEAYADNKFLIELYENKPASERTPSLGFKCQFKFLLAYYDSIVEKINEIVQKSFDEPSSGTELVFVFDRSMWDSLYIFSKAMLESGGLNSDEHYLLKKSAKTFDRSIALILGRSLFPDFVVILDASAECLLARIKERAENNPNDRVRQLEAAGLPGTYLSKLSELYRAFVSMFKLKCTTIETTKIGREESYKRVSSAIREYLYSSGN